MGETVHGGVLATVNDNVLRVTINRPESRNALSRDVIARLSEIFTHWRDDAGIRAAVVTGAGDRAFAAGGDLKELSSLRAEGDVRAFSLETRRAFDCIRDFPLPVIAALNGSAFGGGAELATACDFRVAVSGAGIGFLQGKLAMTTAWGGGIDLMRLVGHSRALELLLSSRVVPANEAMSIGLVDAVAGESESLTEAVARFISVFEDQKPQVIRGFKALAVAARRGEPRARLEELETIHYTATWLHQDHWDAADAAMARISGSSRRQNG